MLISDDYKVRWQHAVTTNIKSPSDDQWWWHSLTPGIMFTVTHRPHTAAVSPWWSWSWSGHLATLSTLLSNTDYTASQTTQTLLPSTVVKCGSDHQNKSCNNRGITCKLWNLLSMNIVNHFLDLQQTLAIGCWRAWMQIGSETALILHES